MGAVTTAALTARCEELGFTLTLGSRVAFDVVKVSTFTVSNPAARTKYDPIGLVVSGSRGRGWQAIAMESIDRYTERRG